MTASLYVFHFFYLPLLNLLINSSFPHAPFSDLSKIPLSLDIRFSSEFRLIKSRRMGLEGQMVLMGESRDARRFFVRKSEGKRPMGRPKRRRLMTIKIFL